MKLKESCNQMFHNVVGEFSISTHVHWWDSCKRVSSHTITLKVQYRGDEIKFQMEILRIERQELLNSLRRLKNRKHPGPDIMKDEIYRWMLDSETCLKTLEKCFN